MTFQLKLGGIDCQRKLKLFSVQVVGNRKAYVRISNQHPEPFGVSWTKTPRKDRTKCTPNEQRHQDSSSDCQGTVSRGTGGNAPSLGRVRLKASVKNVRRKGTLFPTIMEPGVSFLQEPFFGRCLKENPFWRYPYFETNPTGKALLK